MTQHVTQALVDGAHEYVAARGGDPAVRHGIADALANLAMDSNREGVGVIPSDPGFRAKKATFFAVASAMQDAASQLISEG